MIKLNRLALEPGLEQLGEERESRPLECIDACTEPPPAILNSYRDPDLKRHLVRESHGKCIYCESKITHVYFGDVEHIKPKAVFPRERLRVANLALACAVCNNAKGNFWNES